MRPHRAIHALSSLHREAGGLRRLDFFVDRVESWAGESKRGEVSMLILDWQRGALALPFAFMGYRVTVMDTEATTIETARATAKDLGLNVECVNGNISALGNRRFDLIVADFMNGAPNAYSNFAELRNQLSADGNLLIAVPRRGENARWKYFQQNLRSAGWRVREVQCANVFLKNKLLNGANQSWDHFDNWLSNRWPIRLAGGWLCELEPCGIKQPLVMHLMPSLGVGGTEKLVYELVARLPARGFETKAVAMIEGGPLEKDFRERGLPLEIILRRDRFGFSTLRDLSRLFFLQKPDIVHTHLFGADAWGRLAAFWQNVPVVISTEHNVNPTYTAAQRFVNRLFAKKSSLLIAVSDTVKKIMITLDGISKNKIRTIINGIDVEKVLDRGARPFQDIPRLIVVGRLFPQKDHATLFKALALIKKPWRLRVVGTGPLEGELRALAERLGIAPRIEWMGLRHDIPKLLADADLFCFPSRWEGLGLAALEAAVAGLPIIASDLPPLREAFSDQEVTYAPPGDVSAWSRIIDQILSDPATFVAKATRAVPSLRAKVNVENMVAEYADAYQKELKKYFKP